jgi:hypothetical protein
MQWLIDHLAAFIIACTLILILAALQLRGQNASIESVQYDAVKGQLHMFTSVLEQDLLNMGSGLVRPDLIQMEFDTLSETRRFSFQSRTIRGSIQPQQVEYRWKETGEVALASGVLAKTYEVERRVNGAGMPLGSNLTEFHVTLRGQDLQPIADWTAGALAATRRVDVRLKMVSPLGAGELVEESRWQRQVRPYNLQRPGRAIIFQ